MTSVASRSYLDILRIVVVAVVVVVVVVVVVADDDDDDDDGDGMSSDVACSLTRRTVN